MIAVTSSYAARCQPFKVRMTCGHIETRMMREATAGVAWGEDVIIDAPTAQCKECRRKQVGRCYCSSLVETTCDFCRK